MKIYLDHAATTKMSKSVFDEMSKCFFDDFGNANSSHSFGRKAVAHLDTSREIIADVIGAKPKEIYFTSGGTEADNWAIKGLFLANRGKKNRLIVSAIEHSAIIETAKSLSKLGAEVVYIYPNSDGVITASSVQKEIDDNTFLVSVMYVNNETGVINDIKGIAQVCKEYGVLFHTDAVQATTLEKGVNDLGVDLMTISAHKMSGPKGIGLLYVRDGVTISPLIEGGSQESALRGGTSNVPSVVGFACAFKNNEQTIKDRTKKLVEIQNYFETKLLEMGFDIKINGKNRVPSISNITFKGVKASVLLTRLDFLGIAVSAGSACTAGSLEPSHVLMAMGLSEEDAASSVRFSFGEENTLEEIDYTLNAIKGILSGLLHK